MTTFITPGTHVHVRHKKQQNPKPSQNSAFADPGQWGVDQRGPPCPFVYIITQVLSVNAARLLVSRPLLKPTCNLTTADEQRSGNCASGDVAFRNTASVLEVKVNF